MFSFLSLFFKRLRCFPRFFVLVCHDIFFWFKNRDFKKFNGWGLHIYVGMFGQGKTCSMVRDAYKLACRYDGLTIVTNLNLSNFPKSCNIIPLTCGNDILNAPDNTIVLIDEIGTLFNARDFAKSKQSVPKPLFQHLVQCRHRHMMIFGSVQRWWFLDKQLRDITADVTVCSTCFRHPFSRMVTNICYDAYEYELFTQNPLRPLLCIDSDVYVMTDFVRSLYDTKEMVNSLFTMEYIPDDEILANRGEVQPSFAPEGDKKLQKKVTTNLRKGGFYNG